MLCKYSTDQNIFQIMLLQLLLDFRETKNGAIAKPQNFAIASYERLFVKFYLQKNVKNMKISRR